MFNSPQPSDIFTPGAATVNAEMYVHRANLERQVRDALKGQRHFLIHGESGNGKSWLYKKVFQDTQTRYVVINLATAASLGSIKSAIEQKLSLEKNFVEVSHSLEGDANLKPGGIGFSGKKSKTFEVNKENSFVRLLASVKGIRTKHSIIVFDNFERIVSNVELVEELANLLILLDDEDYAKYYTRICLVGIPGNLREYFSQLAFSETISRRLLELNEVERMTDPEARELLTRGFDKLRLSFRPSNASSEMLDRLLFVSDRTADELQMLGLSVSVSAKSNSSLIEDLIIGDSIADWITGKYSWACSSIESKMSPADTRYGRRNQILYCLGQIDTEEFNQVDIKEIIVRLFNSHSEWIKEDFESVFNKTMEGFEPIVKRGTQANMFKISKAVHRMAIRSLIGFDGRKGIYRISKKI